MIQPQLTLITSAAIAFAVLLAFAVCGAEPEDTPIAASSTPPVSASNRETPSMQSPVPKAILEPILNKAAELAAVSREQLVVVRAEPAVWNDGSLGCPEPGVMYTQALVKGYWVVIAAGGKNYDFRVDNGGRFKLCPQGRGHEPGGPAAAAK
jgi:hypothetical protein